MKRFFFLIGPFAFLCAAKAHDSALPHTHSFDQSHSDVFVLSVAGLTALGAGLWWIRSWRKRRNASSIRSRQT